LTGVEAMLTVHITRGLPASGKSTWAKKKLLTNPGGIKRINKDLLREMFDDSHRSKGNEEFVVKARDDLIWLSLEKGKHVIVDDTNLNPHNIKTISKLVSRFRKQYNKSVLIEVIDFSKDVSLTDCIQRDSKRDNPVGEKVITEMYNRWLRPEEYKKTEPMEQDEDLPHAIICDLDGTLALIGGRSPYDGASCYNDDVNRGVQMVLQNYLDRGDGHIIFLSGREAAGKVRKETERWLKDKAKIDLCKPSIHLFMRPAGDYRKDSVLKKEMFESYVKGEYHIDFILDDRNQVVDLWRGMGLPCFQVAPGDF